MSNTTVGRIDDARVTEVTIGCRGNVMLWMHTKQNDLICEIVNFSQLGNLRNLHDHFNRPYEIHFSLYFILAYVLYISIIPYVTFFCCFCITSQSAWDKVKEKLVHMNLSLLYLNY